MDSFTADVLSKFQEFQNLEPRLQSRFNPDNQITFWVGDRKKDELNYTYNKTKNFIDAFVLLIEDLHQNPEKNTPESEAHQILKYDKPFEFKSAPYFTLSPDGNQLRYWIGPHSHASYNHVDSRSQNIIFSIRQPYSIHDFVYSFCSKHSLLIPRYYD